MKHRYLLWLAAALIGTQASAEPRKEAQARQIAEEFLAVKRVTATRTASPGSHVRDLPLETQPRHGTTGMVRL